MSNTIKYERKVVAFFDILGFKNHIDKTIEPNGNEYILNIKSAFDLIYSNLSEHYDPEIVPNIKYSTFSDCVVFSFPIRQHDSLFYTLLPLVWLQAELLWKHEMILRGAITIGDLYHDDDMVFGPALVEAYHLESKIAKYPRIIVANTLKEDFFEWKKELGADPNKLWDHENEERYTYGNEGLLTKDGDYYYVDYLKNIQTELDNPEYYPDFLLFAEKFVAKNLAMELADDVREKYEWLANKIAELA